MENDPNNTDAAELMDFYEKMGRDQLEREASDEWKKNNLEYDLRSTPWILEKARTSLAYAQNLYAAMCNTDCVKNEMWPILQDARWSCSWRHAGGILADMRQEGDYLDFYCSGIREHENLTDEQIAELTPEQITYLEESKKFVSEGVITDEIRADLLTLGWVIHDE